MTTETQPARHVCIVCTEIVLVEFEAWCSGCGMVFHLQQRQDLPGRDCGDVWIDEESLGLDFACHTCLAAQAEAAAPAEPVGLDDVLDLGEAATSINWTENDLAHAAEEGRVKHRRTAGGILLFLRRDLLALTGGHS